MLVADDFQARLRELPAQRREGGQRQDEIADGTAADDEDSVLSGSHR